MEGIPAKISIIGLANVLIFLFANKAKYIAAPNPRGVAINIDPPAINIVPESNGRIPKLGSAPLGAHFVPVKNWIIFIFGLRKTQWIHLTKCRE